MVSWHPLVFPLALASPPAQPSNPAPAPPAAAGRSQGMSLQQWDSMQAYSGGGPAKHLQAGKKPPKRRSTGGTTSKPSESSKSSHPAPAPVVGPSAGTTPKDSKKLSSRALKRSRPYIKWEPTPKQLRHAHLLLRGEAPYAVEEPKRLPSSDSRVKGARKWMCPILTVKQSLLTIILLMN